MFSLRTLPSKLPRVSLAPILLTKTLRPLTYPFTHLSSPRPTPTNSKLFNSLPSIRNYSSASSADSLIEKITEQYALAQDEFEIADEETDKKSVYAESDREAARTELDTLLKMYEEVLEGEFGEEVKKRGIGSKIRQLEAGVKAMEQRAMDDH